MVTDNKYRWDFIGLSTDNKPTPATSDRVVDGSTFYCSDTSKLYVFCKDTWYEKTGTGGGTEYQDFVGTDGETAGTHGLVPAPATTDAGKYLKADGTWSEVSGGTSFIKELTEDDYNYHVSGDTDDTVALWKMDSGIYESYTSHVKTGIRANQSYIANALFIVEVKGQCVCITTFVAGVTNENVPTIANYMGNVVSVVVNKNDGTLINRIGTGGNDNRLLNTIEVQDNLTSTRTDIPLSANQGKVLKDLIDDLTARVVILES